MARPMATSHFIGLIVQPETDKFTAKVPLTVTFVTISRDLPENAREIYSASRAKTGHSPWFRAFLDQIQRPISANYRIRLGVEQAGKMTPAAGCQRILRIRGQARRGALSAVNRTTSLE